MCMCQKHGEKGENLRMKGQYTKLFLIGNGFDRWQGLPTSYGDFRQYYFAHILEITKELRIKTEVDDAGRLITPVEKIFGNMIRIYHCILAKQIKVFIKCRKHLILR